jgi:hypothetical protein
LQDGTVHGAVDLAFGVGGGVHSLNARAGFLSNRSHV